MTPKSNKPQKDWEKKFDDLKDDLYRLIKKQLFDCEITVSELSCKIGKQTYKPNFEDSKKLNTVYKILQNSHHELEGKIIEKLKQFILTLLQQVQLKERERIVREIEEIINNNERMWGKDRTVLY